MRPDERVESVAQGHLRHGGKERSGCGALRRRGAREQDTIRRDHLVSLGLYTKQDVDKIRSRCLVRFHLSYYG